VKYKRTRLKLKTRFGKRKIYKGKYGAYFVKRGSSFERVYPSKARVLKVSTRQTGETTTKLDRKRKALPPGKRRSRNGKVYYEYRKNRSDVRTDRKTKTRKYFKLPKWF